MLDALRALDRQLHDAAQPLGASPCRPGRAVAGAGSVRRRPARAAVGPLSPLRHRAGACRRSASAPADRPDIGSDPLERVDALLERKRAMLARLRRHLRLKALLEIWLYVHVPATFALIAALTAHIVSVFFYW